MRVIVVAVAASAVVDKRDEDERVGHRCPRGPIITESLERFNDVPISCRTPSTFLRCRKSQIRRTFSHAQPWPAPLGDTQPRVSEWSAVCGTLASHGNLPCRKGRIGRDMETSPCSCSLVAQRNPLLLRCPCGFLSLFSTFSSRVLVSSVYAVSTTRTSVLIVDSLLFAIVILLPCVLETTSVRYLALDCSTHTTFAWKETEAYA